MHERFLAAPAWCIVYIVTCGGGVYTISGGPRSFMSGLTWTWEPVHMSKCLIDTNNQPMNDVGRQLSGFHWPLRWTSPYLLNQLMGSGSDC